MPFKRGNPGRCCNSPPPQPTGTCPVIVNINACMVQWNTCYTTEGNNAYQCPSSVNNPNVGATVRLTTTAGAGFDQTLTTGNNTAYQNYANSYIFNVPSTLMNNPFTLTVTATNYQDYSATITPGCTTSPGQLLMGTNWFPVTLYPTQMIVWASVGRCDYPGGAPVYDSGAGTNVSCSLGGSTTGTDSGGNAFITVPFPTWTGTDPYGYPTFSPAYGTVTFQGPDPYYQTVTQTLDFNDTNGGGTGTDPNYVQPTCVIQVSANLPLNSGYLCRIVGQTQSTCLNTATNCTGASPQVRPIPLTLHATVDGVSFTLTNPGSAYVWTNPCVEIHSLCCSISLDCQGWYTGGSGNWGMTITGVIKKNPQTGTAVNPWAQALCYHLVSGSISGGNAVFQQYSPCQYSNCSCSSGDSYDPYRTGDVETFSVFYALVNPSGPGGTTPLNATCYGMTGCDSTTGCPFQGTATVTE